MSARMPRRRSDLAILAIGIVLNAMLDPRWFAFCCALAIGDFVSSSHLDGAIWAPILSALCVSQIRRGA